MRAVLLLIPYAVASGQPVSVGVKASLVTGALDGRAAYRSESRPYTIGATAEVPVWSRLSAEVDLLYRRIGERIGRCEFASCWFERVRAHSWTLPLLAKYRLPFGLFVTGGVAPRWIGVARSQSEGYRTGPMVPSEVVDYTIYRNVTTRRAETTMGVVAGAGFTWRAGLVRFTPEMRYTYWTSRFWEQHGSRGFYTASAPSQLEAMLGITIGRRAMRENPPPARTDQSRRPGR